MEIAPRVRQILLALIGQQEPISVQKLAEGLQVSKRTVQRELDYTAYILKKFSLTLVSKTGVGIWLEGASEDRESLRQQLSGQDNVDYADKNLRRKLLILEMLKDQEPKKLYYYANLLGVSEATVSKDLEHVEKWFANYQLKIVRKQGYGVAIRGRERDYRTAIREFIARNMDTPVLERVYGEEPSVVHAVRTSQIKDAYSLLDDDILRRVATCFSSIPDARMKRLTQDSYIGLVIHVTIAIERVMQGEVLKPGEAFMERLKEDEYYHLALLIIDSLEAEFSLEIPDVEIAFICLHLKGSKLQRTEGNPGDTLSYESREEITELAEEMVVAYDSALSGRLMSDEEFMTGLSAHLRPTLVRLRNQLPIENPHLDEIKTSYPEIYGRCEQVGRLLKARLGMEIPASEIGFLAVHFGAALVRMEGEKELRRTVDVGLVCASGIGISRLMSSKLGRCFQGRTEISTYGQEDLTPYILQKNDFFVSSLRLRGVEADVLYVSPLLPEEDMRRIEEKVRHYEREPKQREDRDFSMQLDKINRLTAVIREILRKFRCIMVPGQVTFRELVQRAAQRITPYGENQARLVADIMRREEIATQVVPELGIALLHARTRGVFQPEIYVIRPEGGSFTQPYLQEAAAAVIMLIPDDENKRENSHLAGSLTEKLAEDEEFLQQVKTAEEEKLREEISKALKEYFHGFLDRV